MHIKINMALKLIYSMSQFFRKIPLFVKIFLNRHMKITKELIEKVGVDTSKFKTFPFPWEIIAKFDVNCDDYNIPPGYFICDADDEVVLDPGGANIGDLDLVITLLLKLLPNFAPNT